MTTDHHPVNPSGSLNEEHAQLKIALQESETRMRLVFNAAKLGIFEWDIINDRSFWENNHMYEIFGHSPEDGALSKSHFLKDYLYPDDLAAFENTLSEAIASNSHFSQIFRIRRKKDQALRWLEINAEIELDEYQQPRRLIGVVKDITGRRRAEEEIHHLNRQMKGKLDEMSTLLDILPTGVWIGNADCSHITGNPAAYRMLNIPFGSNASVTAAEPEFPEDIRLFIGKEEVEAENAPMQQVARTGKPLYQVEHGFLFPDGSTKSIYANIVPVFDQQGKVRRVIGSYLDLTERKQQEENQKLLLEITQELGRINDVEKIMELVGRRLGRHLKVDRCAFVEFDWPAQRAVVIYNWCREGMDSVVGNFSISHFLKEESRDRLSQGLQLVYTDVKRDDRIVDQGRQYTKYHIRSAVTTPFLWENDCKYTFSVHATEPRDWSPEELNLLREVSNYTWSRIEHVHAEKAIRESEQELQKLADAMPQVVWVADAYGQIYYCNQKVKELHPQAMTDQGWDWKAVIHPDDLAITATAWAKAVQERSTYKIEHRFRMKDGTFRWHLCRAVPILDQQGAILKWYGTATEIHELKATQQELQASKEYFRRLADASPAYIWQSGPDMTCIYFNKGWLEYTGRTLSQEMGNGWTEGVHPDDLEHCLHIYRSAFEQQQPFEMEYRLKRFDGEYRWLLDHGVPIYDHNHVFTGYIGSCIDINERKTLEEQKDLFVRIGGHELRTPLTSLIGYLSLIKKTTEPEQPGRQYLEKAYKSALKMRTVVQDFLDVYRLQTGEITYKVTEFDLDELVDEVLEDVQSAYPKLQIHRSGRAKASIQGDRSRLEQAFLNLLSNAVKYSTDQARVDLTLKRVAPSIELIFKDYGIGIEQSELSNIFKRFYRAQNIGKVRGMGLGLFFVKQVITFHKGKISVKSRPGEGSTFTIELPLA